MTSADHHTVFIRNFVYAWFHFLFLSFININVAVLCIFLFLSEGDKDATPTVCAEKGVGGSSQLHLWTERGLHPFVQGSKGCHVCTQIHTHVHVNTRKILTLCFCPFRLSLLRYNTNLTRYKNMLFSHSQQLQAKLSFFKTSIQHDLERYTQQRQVGICEWMLMSHFSV